MNGRIRDSRIRLQELVIESHARAFTSSVACALRNASSRG